MGWLDALEDMVGRVAALAMVAAAGETLFREDDGAVGFRAVCRLTLAVALLRAFAGLLG